MYNNETGLYENDPSWLWEGDWFEDKAGFLYIVPKPNVTAEIEGLDNEIQDQIAAACRDHKELTDEDCERIGLTRIPDALKRFTPEDGYYHA